MLRFEIDELKAERRAAMRALAQVCECSAEGKALVRDIRKINKELYRMTGRYHHAVRSDS